MYPSTHILSFISIMSLMLASLTACGEKRIHVATSTETPGQEILLEPTEMKPETTTAGLIETSVDDSDLSLMDSEIDSASEEPPTTSASVMPNEPVNMAHAPRIAAKEESSGHSIFGTNHPSSHSSTPNPNPSSMPESEFTENISGVADNNVVLSPLSEKQHVSTPSNSSIEAKTSEEAYTSNLSDNAADFLEDTDGPLLESSSDLINTPFSRDESLESENSFSQEELELGPNTIEIAKAQPSNSLQDQITRMKKEELATVAAGLQDVFFPFDSWTLTKEGKLSLKSTLDWFKHDFSSVLIIEGHSDQRGTQAYNMILGKRRAHAIRDYLSKSGIDPSHLIPISYGKDKPFCQDITEVCHQLNRRGHLLVQNP